MSTFLRDVFHKSKINRIFNAQVTKQSEQSVKKNTQKHTENETTKPHKQRRDDGDQISRTMGLFSMTNLRHMLVHRSASFPTSPSLTQSNPTRSQGAGTLSPVLMVAAHGVLTHGFHTNASIFASSRNHAPLSLPLRCSRKHRTSRAAD